VAVGAGEVVELGLPARPRRSPGSCSSSRYAAPRRDVGEASSATRSEPNEPCVQSGCSPCTTRSPAPAGPAQQRHRDREDPVAESGEAGRGSGRRCADRRWPPAQSRSARSRGREGQAVEEQAGSAGGSPIGSACPPDGDGDGRRGCGRVSDALAGLEPVGHGEHRRAAGAAGAHQSRDGQRRWVVVPSV